LRKLTDPHIHIISFDVPLPADYGGVIDVFYKIKALYELGYKIHLHAYEYGRGRNKELNLYCQSVNYYERNLSRQNLFLRKPFIVVSRNSQSLYENLLKDDYPILFEGLHSTYYLDHPDFASRRKIVRSHNIEHEYYRCLAEAERSIFKRYYFQNEASKLERHEDVLEHVSGVAAISEPDKKHFDQRFSNIEWISAFHPFSKVEAKEGLGSYALYHGNLAVPENDKAAIYLAKQIFSALDVEFVIAGNDPSPELRELVARNSNIKLKADISTKEIDYLIQNAQINVLPTFQATGIKLKLLSALFQGRHALVNSPMVEGTGLEDYCVIANSVQEMQDQVKRLMVKEFNSGNRSDLERSPFSNSVSASKLDALIRGDQ